MEATMVSPTTAELTCLTGIDDLSAQTQKLLLEASGTLQACFIPLLSLWTTFSNLVIMIAIFKFNSSHSPYAWLLCSQVFSDFVTGVSVMPLMLHMAVEMLVSIQSSCNLRYVPKALHYFLYFHWVSTLGTVSNFAISSIDRYFAISRPLRYRATVTARHVQQFLAAFWILLFALELKLTGVTAFNLVVLLLGVLITIVFQILVLKAFRKHNNATGSLRNPTVSSMRQEKTMAKRIGLLIGTLCCCILPMAVFFALKATLGKALDSWHVILGPWVVLIFYTNSAINPFLYCWKNENTKNAVKKLLGIR